jgi:hypothetical protein
MPRLPTETSALVADLTARIERLAEAARAEGRASALASLRAVLEGGAPRRGPGRPRKDAAPVAEVKPRRAGKRRKNPWAGLSPAERLARVNAIRKGRGLPLKESL